MTLFSDAVIDHFAELKTQAGEGGTYRQASKAGALTMVPAISINEQVTGEGVTLASKDADFIATIADLQAINCWPPLRGDTFEYTSSSGITGIFEAMPDGGEQVFDFASNTSKIAVRIHMKEVKA